MIREEFRLAMQLNRGCAVIMAGSDSDKGHIDEIVKSLQKYGIQYNSVRSLVVYVAVAGGTDALSGTLSYHAFGPVISCPPDGRNGSCLSNPPGSSNAYIERPANVGRFIAQMYAGVNPALRKMLDEENAKKINSLEQADTDFQRNYGGIK
ncbi:hypothetical protein J4221_06175 [Candidatus Pacearchaeota archaeon]|nr:hypothetical protein [Candidatus Pacearchaeota archaeon]